MTANNKRADRDYLKDEQVRNSGNLRSRISLHEKFSANPRPWHERVFVQIQLPPSAAILEGGCSPGSLFTPPLAGMSRLRAMLQEELESHGSIAVIKESGLLIARKSGHI